MRALKALFSRRVPHILGVYLGGSWGVVEFLRFVTDRYVLSPHLVDFSLFTLALFIPSVALLAWFHGRPGDDRWQRTETVGISANVVVGALVLYLLFGGKELGAVTTTVSTTDEEGNRVERTVPKSEFRKEVALFYFDNETGNPELDWLSYGFVDALETDLDQDLFVRSGIGFTHDLQQKGFEDATGVPMALKREIARSAPWRHFLSGSIQTSASGYTVRTELRETESGDLVEARTFSGSDILALVDSASIQLRRDLDVPSGHLEKSEDLPVAELTTTSPEAFRAYAKGYRARTIRDDLDAAQEALEQAVSLDSTFALAQWSLAGVYQQQNRSGAAEKATSAAMDHLYKLPLRYRFQVKDDFYALHQQPDKRIAVAEMRVEFYPEDVEAHLKLADLYRQRNRLEEALQEYQRVLEIDPGRYDHYDPLGDLYTEMGRYEEARAAYRTYAEHFPDEADPLHELGLLYQRTGELDSARVYFEKAHLIKPDHVGYLLHLAEVERYAGNFENARQQLQRALDAAATPSNRRHVLEEEVDHHKMRGQIRKALEAQKKVISIAGTSDGAFDQIVQSFDMALLYALIGQGEQALTLLDELERQAQPPLDRLAGVGRGMVYLEQEDPAALEGILPEVRALIEDFGIESFRGIVLLIQGEVHRLRARCRKALPLYDSVLTYHSGAGTETETRTLKAACYRNLDRLDEAESEVREGLELIPAHPKAHLERARIHLERGDTAEAVDALEEALRVYAPADSDHVHASEVRTLYEELGG